MAGTDPLSLYQDEEPDFSRPKMGGKLERLWSDYQQFKRTKKTREQADASLPELESMPLTTSAPIAAPENVPTGRLMNREGAEKRMQRDASPHGELLDWIDLSEERLREKQAGIKTWDDAEAYFADAEKVADYRAELYERIRKQTIADRKAGKLSAQAFNERMTALVGEMGKDGRTGGLRGDVETMRKQIAEQRAQTAERRKQAETAQEYKSDPMFHEKVFGLMKAPLEWSPIAKTISFLSGPVETVGAIGSLAAETLGADKQYKQELGIGEILESAEFGGPGQDSAVRKRGREFWAEAGEQLALAHEQSPVGIGFVPMQAIDALEHFEYVKPGDAHKYRALSAELGLQIAADPLNAIDFGPGVVKQLGKLEKLVIKSKPFLKFASKHPKIAYAPSKFIRYATGHAKEAAVMGDEGMTNLLQAERNFVDEAGYEYAKLRHDALAAEAATATRLEKPEDLLRLKEDLPGAVEKGKDWRMAQREIVEDTYQKVLLDAADQYDDLGARAYALDQKWSRKYGKLGGEYAWFGRRYSDQLADFIAKHPDAQAVLFGEQAGRSKEALLNALQDWEKGRKLRDFDFLESEGIVRESLRAKGIPVPDDMPVWSRDAFGDVARRAEKAQDAAKLRNLYLNFAEEFGIPVGAPDLVEQVMGKWSKLERPPVVGPKPDAASLDDVTKAETIARENMTAAGYAEWKAHDDLRSATDAAGAARARMQEASAAGDAAQAAARRKQAKDDYFKAQDQFNAGDAKGHEAMKDATRRLKEAEEALKKARASNATPEDIARLQREVADAEAAAAKSKTAWEDASKRSKKADDDWSATREAATKAKADYDKAYADWEAAAKADQSATPENWSAHAKAAWVQGQVGRPAGRALTALDVLLKSKAQLPDDVGELARLASTLVTKEDATKFRRYLENFHWQHLDKPHKILQGFDAVKRVFQRALLSRFSSVSKDNIGAFTQSVLAGNWTHLEGARKALGGNPVTWANGAGTGFTAAPDVIHLMNKGVLETTVGEAMHGKPFFQNRVLRNIEERGVLGGLIPGKAGEAVGKVTDTFMHQRVWFEQVNRLATYRKAIADGLSDAEAIEEVYKYWGKFDELTKLERDVFSRIFMFWSWMARSVPITGGNLLDHPARMKLGLMIMAGDARGDQGDNMPEWMKRMGGWILGKDENGNVDVLSAGSSTYASPLFSFLQGDMVKAMGRGDIEEVPGLGLREVMRSAPSFVSAPFERAQKRDYFTNQDWWKDMDTQTGSNMKAPSFMYHLMDPSGQKPTLLQSMLGLKAETDPETGQFKRVTMDPRWAWLLDALPGVAPVLTDASAFTHPGMVDAGGEFSIKAGIARQVGLPIYHVNPPSDAQSDAYELRNALIKDIDRLSSGSLYYDNGAVLPSERTTRGRQLKAAREQWNLEAKQQKLSDPERRAFVMDRMKAEFTDEWRLYELNDRLRVVWMLAKNEKLPEPGDDLGVKLPSDKRLTKQAEREKKRKISEFEGLLK